MPYLNVAFCWWRSWSSWLRLTNSAAAEGSAHEDLYNKSAIVTSVSCHRTLIMGRLNEKSLAPLLLHWLKHQDLLMNRHRGPGVSTSCRTLASPIICAISAVASLPEPQYGINNNAFKLGSLIYKISYNTAPVEESNNPNCFTKVRWNFSWLLNLPLPTSF